LLVTAVAALLLAAPAAALENPILIPLAGSEGRFGSATLFQSGDRVLVNVDFVNVKLDGAGVQIDEGSCGRLGGVRVELSDSVNGQSQTQIPGTDLRSFVAKPHAVVVRKSPRADAPLLACGNIKG
jgi:hypothetical protein